MALRLSTGAREKMVSTLAIKELLDGGFMDIFTGSQPATADAVETGTKLVRISSASGTAATAGLRFGTSLGGILPITDPAWSGVVSPAGVAGWFRFYGTGGASGVSGSTGTNGTAIRVDGNVGVSGADLNLTHTSLSLDSTLTIKTFSITQPAE
jgi:hypothetical protein